MGPQAAETDINEERGEAWRNLQLEIGKMMKPHDDYIKKMEAGKTPFRNADHLINVLGATNLPLKLDPEEQAVRDTLLEVFRLKDVSRIRGRSSASTTRNSTRRSSRQSSSTLSHPNTSPTTPCSWSATNGSWRSG